MQIPPMMLPRQLKVHQFIGKSCRLNDALTFFETDQSQGKNAGGGCDRTVQFGKERRAAKVTPRIFSPVLYCPYS